MDCSSAAIQVLWLSCVCSTKQCISWWQWMTCDVAPVLNAETSQSRDVVKSGALATCGVAGDVDAGGSSTCLDASLVASCRRFVCGDLRYRFYLFACYLPLLSLTPLSKTQLLLLLLLMLPLLICWQRWADFTDTMTLHASFVNYPRYQRYQCFRLWFLSRVKHRRCFIYSMHAKSCQRMH